MNAPARPPGITVAAGIITRGRSVLICQRPPGSHLEGSWEFPGGKVETGESPAEALCRELEEEVGLVVSGPVLLHRHEHRYRDRDVELFFYLCRDVEGEPSAAAGHPLRWVTLEELARMDTPAANRQVIELLEANLG